MARNNESLTRVEYWASYRKEIKDEILASEKKPKKGKKPKKIKKVVKPVIKKKVATRAETLLDEYEKKKGITESRKETNIFLILLAIIILLLVIAGVVFLVSRYM